MPPAFTDARGRTLTLAQPPRRLVSLVPSQTELLAALGCDPAVVGLTRFCIHPPDWKTRKTVVGGTKQVRLDRVRALRPDLVLANLEENTQADVEALDAEMPVYVTDVRDLLGAVAMIQTVGRLVGAAALAEPLAQAITAGFAALPAFTPRRACYLIWRDPFMTVGHDTIIHDVMARAGLENVFGASARYPVVTPEDLRTAAPEVVLLSSEPYPFDVTHVAELAALVPDAAVHLVDGELFSWYGSRLRHTPAYLETLRTRIDTPQPSSSR